MKRNFNLNKTYKKLRKYYKTRLRSVLPYIILTLLILVYTLFFSILSIDRHNRFQSLAFDLGINDQAIWQFSRFDIPFNTVRGIHILGDHFALINIFVSPIYWFSDNVRTLLIFQTFIFAIAIIPLFLIAKHYFKNKWVPLIFCFTYLLFPALHYVTLEDYHPEAFIPFFLLFAFYFIIKKKKWPYLIFFFLTLLTKEEITLTTFLLGFYVYFKFDKKLGIFTSLFSLVWFLLVIKVFVPFFNGYGYLYGGHLLSSFGSKPLEILSNFLNPKVLFPIIFTSENGTFIWELFAPVGFLSLLNPVTLILAASLWMNIITSWPYSHTIQYHHIIPIIPFVFISIIIGLSRFRKKRVIIYPLLAFLLICSLISNYYIAPYDSSIKNFDHIKNKFKNFNVPSENEKQLYAMIDITPADASVSASYFVVPHLTHRNKIYNFPNPLKSHYWGNWKEGQPSEYVDYLLLHTGHVEEHKDVLQPLIQNGTYIEIKSSNDFVLFELQK